VVEATLYQLLFLLLFYGNFTDEKASCTIEGFFNIIPKEVENSVGPEIEILIVLYNVIFYR